MMENTKVSLDAHSNHIQKLMGHAVRHLNTATATNEAVLFHLSKMACQAEAALSLLRACDRLEKEGKNTDLLKNLTLLQAQNATSQISSKMAEYHKDFGWSSAQGVFSSTPDGLSLSQVVDLGKIIAKAGGVPELSLNENHVMIRDTFRKLADTLVQPEAEKIHREDLLLPENFIIQLKEMGCFGLSIPESYGGFQSDTDPDHCGMVIVTEELSRGSLGAAGSLITRPEILARALLKGGTEEQKKHWLPLLAMGEKMVGIAVTEPDHGSDVAGLRFSATKNSDGYWILSGTKTWCTFAGRANVLAVLARTNPDMSLRHKGLSLILVEKPVSTEHVFQFSQPEGGTMEGRAIPTIGYRGMHSYEVTFNQWKVPASCLVGEESGLGKGFYLQMEGFAAGRLQTAARANGLMHAALEKAIHYSNERKIFGSPIAEHAASSQKLSLMAATLLASRALTQEAVMQLNSKGGSTLAAMAKLFSSQSAEWLTREALQLHGGMGYAEEFSVSRYFVDARVLSIFEGAEEVLAVKVIAPALLEKPNAS